MFAQNSNNWSFPQQQQPHSGAYGGGDFLSDLSSTPTSTFASFGTSASSFTPTAQSGFASQYAAARQKQSQNGSAHPSQHTTPGSNVTTPLEAPSFDFTPIAGQPWPAQPQQRQQEQLPDQGSIGAFDPSILAGLAEMMGQAQNNPNEPQLPLSLLSALGQQALAQAQQPAAQQPLAPQMQQQQSMFSQEAQAQEQTPFPGITQQQFVQMLQQAQQQQQVQAAQAQFQAAQQQLQAAQQQAAQAQQQMQQAQAQATASHQESQEHTQAQAHQTSLLTRRMQQQQQSQSQSNTPAHSPRPSFTPPGRSSGPSANGVSVLQPFTQVRPTNNQRVPPWQSGERMSDTAATTPATSEASMSSPADVSRKLRHY